MLPSAYETETKFKLVPRADSAGSIASLDQDWKYWVASKDWVLEEPEGSPGFKLSFWATQVIEDIPSTVFDCLEFDSNNNPE